MALHSLQACSDGHVTPPHPRHFFFRAGGAQRAIRKSPTRGSLFADIPSTGIETGPVCSKAPRAPLLYSGILCPQIWAGFTAPLPGTEPGSSVSQAEIYWPLQCSGPAKEDKAEQNTSKIFSVQYFRLSRTWMTGLVCSCLAYLASSLAQKTTCFARMASQCRQFVEQRLS